MGDNRSLKIVFTNEDVRYALSEQVNAGDLILAHGIPSKEVASYPPEVVRTVDPKNVDIEPLRQTFHQQFVKVGNRHEKFWEHENMIFINVVLPIANLLATVIELVRTENIREVYIYGSVCPDYIPVYGGEGEVVKQFEYFPQCFYPGYVAQTCKTFDISTKIIPSKKKVLMCKVRRWMRADIIDIAKTWLLLIQRLRLRGVRYFCTRVNLRHDIDKNYDQVIILRGDVSIQFFKNYVQWLRKQNISVLLVLIELLQRDGCESNALKEFKDFPKVSLVDVENPVLLIKALLKGHWCRVNRFCGKTIRLRSANYCFEIRLDSLERELVRGDIDKTLEGVLLRKLFRKLRGRVGMVLTGEMYGANAMIHAREAKRAGGLVGNVQIANICFRNVINLVPGDFFLAVSKLSELDAKRYTFEARCKVQHWGSFKYPGLVLSKVRPNSALKRVIFFTQPVFEEENHIISRQLSRMAKHYDFELIIKPHPRDFINYLGYECENVVALNRTGLSIEELVESAQLVVSSNSATLMDALFIGVPYIACLLNVYTRLEPADFLNEDLGVVVRNVDQLIPLVGKFEDYRRSYFQRRETFLKKSLRIPFNLPELARIFHPKNDQLM